MSKFTSTANHLLTSHINELQGPLIKNSNLILPQTLNSHDIVEPHGPHCPLYFQRFVTKTLTPGEEKSTSFRKGLTKLLVPRTLKELDATYTTMKLAIEHGVACSTSGGTHHAFRERGTGFTILNDVAVGVRKVIRDTGGVGGITVVDLDVHQGDGNACLLRGLEGVRTVSVHCGENFPFVKEVSDWDVEVPEGTGDEVYLGIVEEVLEREVKRGLGLVVYIAGVDIWEGDKLGRLKVSEEGGRRRDYMVVKKGGKEGVPVATIVGGGYSEDEKIMGGRHAGVIEEAARVWREDKVWKGRR